jgi:hypothetical protein
MLMAHCSIFKDVVTNSNITALNDDLERKWKEEVVTNLIFDPGIFLRN